MIIDLILDRRDDLKHGIDNYDPREFYQDIVAYEDSFEGLGQAISIALDTGEEDDVKAALKQYIDDQEYNEEIKDFIDSVSWLNEDIDGATEYGGELVSAKTKIKEVIQDWETETETKQQITGKVLLDTIVDGLNNDEDFVLFMQALYQSIDTFVSSFTQEGSSSYLTVGFVDTLSLEQIEELGSAYYYYDHDNVIKPTDNPMELFLDTVEYREHVEKALDTLLSLYSGDYAALYNDKKELYELEDDDGFLYQFLPDPSEFGITEDLTWATETHEGDYINDLINKFVDHLIEIADDDSFDDVIGVDVINILIYNCTDVEYPLMLEFWDAQQVREERGRVIKGIDRYAAIPEGFTPVDSVSEYFTQIRDDVTQYITDCVNHLGSIEALNELLKTNDINEFDVILQVDDAYEDDIITESNKPKAQLIGADGNIYNLMGIAQRALRRAGMKEEGDEMVRRITSEANSYDEALNIIGEYVEYGDSNESKKPTKGGKLVVETNQLKEKYGAPLDISKRPKVSRVKHWHSFLEEFGVDEGHYDFYCKKGDFFIAQTEPKTLIHLGAVDTVAFNTKDEPVKLEDIGLDRDFLLRMEK